jgi:hypothetical protein
MSNYEFGLQHIKLSWGIPIFASEHELIKKDGLASLDLY